MANGAYIALSAAVAAHKRLDVTANNLANLSTTGFKQQRLTFAHTLSNAQAALSQSDKGYVQTTASHLNFAQGPITSTDNPLDIALQGDGFLQVQGPQGPLLTRNGALTLSQDGHLVDHQGRHVLVDGEQPGTTRDLSLNTETPLVINEQGQLFQGEQMVGTLAIVTCDLSTVRAQGDGSLDADPQTFVAAGDRVRVLSGHLEGSNVNAIANLTQLIEIQRGYQSTQRIMDRYSKTDSKAIDSIG